MKKIIIVLLTCMAVIKGYAQPPNLLFGKFKFDSSYQLVGLCPYEDDTKEYKNLTFLIKDTTLLKKAFSTTVYGERILKPLHEENSLEIYVVTNKKIVENYSVSPKYNDVFFYVNDTTPATFEFNPADLITTSNVHPLNYIAKLIAFKTKEELNNFLKINLRKENFLCYDDITEQGEGKFYIVIKSGVDIKNASQGMDLIKSALRKITPNENDYLIGYEPNLSDLTVLKYFVSTSKNVYDKFNLVKYPKGNWIQHKIEIFAYWAK